MTLPKNSQGQSPDGQGTLFSPQTYSSPEQVLKDVFGYDSFRPMQREIIEQVLAGRDTLAIMPTGGGKSLCYQIPALLGTGMTIVVSPLIALMQDQVSALQAAGVGAAFLSSTLDWESYSQVVSAVRRGDVKLLYLSPEALARSEKIQLLTDGLKIGCITIDEAHCISEWGHDFRPDYRTIAEVRALFPQAACLALTATATDRVRQDIVANLSLTNPAVFIASFNRPNIFLEVATKRNPFQQVRRCIDAHPGESGIIYCFSRRQVDELTSELRNAGYNALSYHAGLPDKTRTNNQQLFIRDKVQIMVATVAFGMGINKPNVRFVIHYDMPKSLEQYYQEIGRAGRDGEDSHALLLYSPADIRKIRFFMEEMDEQQEQAADRLLHSMIQYATSRRCRRNVLLSYFGDRNPALAATVSGAEATAGEHCCDICATTPPDITEATIPVQKLLSCILRTGERFGASYVIDILLGSRQRRILDNGHDKLSTWGIGRELSRDEWFELVTCLVEYGYLKKTSDYNVLSLTHAARLALKTHERFLLPITLSTEHGDGTSHKGNAEKEAGSSGLLYPKPTGKGRTAASTSGSTARPAQKKHVLAADDTLGQRIYIALKELRRRLAEDEDLPPYIIFPDKTLTALAAEKPTTQEALLDIHGIGTVKAERYGKAILRIINES